MKPKLKLNHLLKVKGYLKEKEITKQRHYLRHYH
jgi:hypothetical protein